MLRTEYINNESTWLRALNSFNTPHFLQTFQWGEIKDQFGWKSIKVALYKETEIVAVALLLKKKIPLLKSSIIYCPRGPIFNTDDCEEIKEILLTIKKVAQNEGAISIKIDSELLSDDKSWINALKALNWKKSSEVQFRNTAIVDLTYDEDKILSCMKKKGRYNIKVAARNEVEIQESNRELLDDFFNQYTNTGRRNNFITRSIEYYKTVAEAFFDSGNGTLFTAHHQGDFLAGAFVIHLKDRAWYFYGSSGDEKRNLMPTYLLHWEIIKWAKSKGLKDYDMWGAPEVLNEKDSMWGVYKFKENLGAKFRDQAGAYDLTLKPFSNFFVNKVIPLVQILRKKIG